MSKYIEKLMKSKCAPHLNKENDKCYTLKQLKKIATKLNTVLKKNNKPLIKLSQKKSNLWNDIYHFFKKKCAEDDKCWLKQKEIEDIVDDNMELFTFKVDMPEEWKNDKFTWLNSLDIYYFMILAEKVYKTFKFYKPVPSDCPNGINCELTNLNLKELYKQGKKKIGIIYNLDVSTGPGTHWTAVYIDIQKEHINYYDSTGSVPLPSINKFLIKLSKQMNNPVMIYNDSPHQREGSECGMFSMNFLLQRLENKSMYEISKANYTDEKMNKLRKVFYYN
tara:strand:- start:339 stop:1172 length:834 start_codon:yes stop_codon:yes gene_type:complete